MAMETTSICTIRTSKFRPQTWHWLKCPPKQPPWSSHYVDDLCSHTCLPTANRLPRWGSELHLLFPPATISARNSNNERLHQLLLLSFYIIIHSQKWHKHKNVHMRHGQAKSDRDKGAKDLGDKKHNLSAAWGHLDIGQHDNIAPKLKSCTERVWGLATWNFEAPRILAA